MKYVFNMSLGSNVILWADGFSARQTAKGSPPYWHLEYWKLLRKRGSSQIFWKWSITQSHIFTRSSKLCGTPFFTLPDAITEYLDYRLAFAGMSGSRRLPVLDLFACLQIVAIS